MKHRAVKNYIIRQNGHGFTLIEIMIALAIFSVGFLAIAGLQHTSMNGNRRANSVARSTNWAASQIENLMNVDYVDVVSGSREKGNEYRVEWGVTKDTPIKNVATIDITVKFDWSSILNSYLRETTLRYYKADNF